MLFLGKGLTTDSGTGRLLLAFAFAESACEWTGKGERISSRTHQDKHAPDNGMGCADLKFRGS